MILFISYPKRDMSFYDWATSVSTSGVNVEVPVVPKDPLKWRDWAYALIRSSPLAISLPVPLRSVYPKEEDWRKWAMQVIQNVQ